MSMGEAVVSLSSCYGLDNSQQSLHVPPSHPSSCSLFAPFSSSLAFATKLPILSLVFSPTPKLDKKGVSYPADLSNFRILPPLIIENLRGLAQRHFSFANLRAHQSLLPYVIYRTVVSSFSLRAIHQTFLSGRSPERRLPVCCVRTLSKYGTTLQLGNLTAFVTTCFMVFGLLLRVLRRGRLLGRVIQG